MGIKLKWVVEIEVDARIVGDGFDLTDVRAVRMLKEHLPYAFGSELGARVLEAPKESEIRKLQGASFEEVAKLRAVEEAVETGDCGCAVFGEDNVSDTRAFSLLKGGKA